MNGKRGHLPEWVHCLLEVPFQLELQESGTRLFHRCNRWFTSVHKYEGYLSAASRSASAPTSALDADPRNLLGSFRNNRKCLVCKNTKKKYSSGGKRTTLDPTDLRCRAVTQLVLRSYSEDDGRAVGGGAVDVGVVQVGRAD